MNVVENPVEYFEELASLHDARIVDCRFEYASGNLYLRIDDVNSGFLGMPEYAGEKPAVICFDGCTKEVNEFESPNIYSLKCSVDASGELKVVINTWPSGNMEFSCKSVAISMSS